MQPQYLGNMDLLNMTKVGFLASRHTAPASVLPTLDWATEIRHREDVTVISGFQSPLERHVLDILLQGRCGIICVLNRGMYKRLPGSLGTLFSQNRLLFVSLIKSTITRPSMGNALKRNHYIVDIADRVVFASVSPSSSLYPLLNINKSHVEL